MLLVLDDCNIWTLPIYRAHRREQGIHTAHAHVVLHMLYLDYGQGYIFGDSENSKVGGGIFRKLQNLKALKVSTYTPISAQHDLMLVLYSANDGIL